MRNWNASRPTYARTKVLDFRSCSSLILYLDNQIHIRTRYVVVVFIPGVTDYSNCRYARFCMQKKKKKKPQKPHTKGEKNTPTLERPLYIMYETTSMRLCHWAPWPSRYIKLYTLSPSAIMPR